MFSLENISTSQMLNSFYELIKFIIDCSLCQQIYEAYFRITVRRFYTRIDSSQVTSFTVRIFTILKVEVPNIRHRTLHNTDLKFIYSFFIFGLSLYMLYIMNFLLLYHVQLFMNQYSGVSCQYYFLSDSLMLSKLK